MASMAADTFCSRCKSYSHLSKDCTSKPFIRVFCAHCNRPGHSMEACPKKAFEEREKKRAENKKAFEEREQRRAEQQRARAEQRTRTDNMAARTEVTSKSGKKACKDRCQTCWRKF